MNRNILVLDGDNSNYEKPFEFWGDIYTGVDYLEDMDLVVFTGGTDVNPSLYGDTPHEETTAPDIQRDTMEQAVYTRALILGIPMVGICRGAQFLCVMNGGSLIQHVNGHRNCEHEIFIKNRTTTINVRGDHHQMLWPKEEFDLLAYSEGLSTVYETGEGLTNQPEIAFTKNNIVQEPEVVHWPLTRCLAIQFHPEWHRDTDPASFYFQDLLDKLVM